MAKKINEISVEEKLRALYDLQIIRFGTKPACKNKLEDFDQEFVIQSALM